MSLRGRPSCGGGGTKKIEPAARDDVVPMTAQLFALGTKNSSNTALVQERLLRDRFVLIRHGERQDHADKAWKGNRLLPLYDPPLSNMGRRQSFETALKYYTLKQEKKVEQRIEGTFSAILVSPFHRCLETALILNIVAFEGSLAMFVDPQLSDWQQQRVFRVTPNLGGHFALGTETTRTPCNMKSSSVEDGEASLAPLIFIPQQDALRATLAPFFAAYADKLASIAETHKVTAEAAAAWSTHLEVWLANHTALPVWTSAATEATVAAQLTKRQERSLSCAAKGGHDGNTNRENPGPSKGRKSGGGSGKASPALAAETSEALCHYTHCGVAHPESRADLQRRCQQLEQTHFLRSEASERQIPALVTVAVAKERKERLPKYFQTFDARPEASHAKAGPAVLLPPMHIMAVTHADVIATMVDVCCPRYLGDASGKSVPYCSVTALMRHNNYYRIPPLEERPAPAVGTGRQQQARGMKGRKHPCIAAPLRGSAATAAEELPLDWQVEVVGSTDLLLTTRVVLKFN